MKNSLRNNNIKLIFKALACFVFAIISIFGVMLLCQPTKSANGAEGAYTYNYSDPTINSSTKKTIGYSFMYNVYNSYSSSRVETIETIKFIKDPTSSPLNLSNNNVCQHTNSGYGSYLNGTTLYVWGGTCSLTTSSVYNSTTKETDCTYNYTTTIYTNLYISDPTYLFCRGSAKETLFSSCKKIDFSEVTFSSNITDMRYMFAYLPKLTTITFPSSFSTAKVTDMNHMFYGDYSLTTDNFNTIFENFDTSKVTNMSYMFALPENLSRNTSQIKTLYFSSISNFKTTLVEDMSYMFSGRGQLTTLDFGSNFATSTVTNMCGMFQYCASLTSLDLTSFNTLQVTDMSQMFSVMPFNAGESEIGKLSSITVDKTNFNTSQVTTMYDMFAGCALTNFNGADNNINIDAFDITSLTNMSYMFRNCFEVTKIDISKIANKSASSQISNVNGLFAGCFQHSTINAISDVVVGLVEFLPPQVTSMRHFFACWNLGTDFKTKITYETVPLLFKGGTKITGTAITNISGLFEKCKNIGSGTIGTEALYQNVTDMFANGGKAFNTYTSIYGLFKDVTSIKSLKGIENLDTSNVTSLKNFFEGTSIEDLDGIGKMKLNSGDLNISGMFKNCTSLKNGLMDTLDAYNTALDFGTRNITAQNLFDNCGMSDFSVLDAFDFSECTSIDLTKAFAYTNITTKVDGKTYELGGNVTLTYLFYYSYNASSSLQALGNIKIKNVSATYPKVNYMFNGRTRTNLNGLCYFFETNPNLQNLDYMFANSLSGSTDSEATSAYSLSSVTSATYMFHSCSNLTSLSNNFDGMFENLKNGSYMFYDCSKLTGDLFKRTTFPVLTNGRCMFYNCDNLLDTRTSSIFSGDEMFPQLQNASYMFAYCNYLTSLKDFNITGQITTIEQMFTGCSSLTALDGLENLNCDNVYDIYFTFYGCSALTDATAFTNHNFPKTITRFAYAFNGCSSLQVLDLSKMKLDSNNTNALSGCSALKILIAPSFSSSSYNLSLPRKMYNVDGDGTDTQYVYSTDNGKEFSALKLTVKFYDSKSKIPSGTSSTSTKIDYVYSRLLKNASGEYEKDANGHFQFADLEVDAPEMPTNIKVSGTSYIFKTWNFSDSTYGSYSDGKVTLLGSVLGTKMGEQTLTLTASWEQVKNLVNLMVSDSKYEDFLVFKDKDGNVITEFNAKYSGQTLTITLETPTSANNHLVATITYGKSGTVDTYYVYKGEIDEAVWTSSVTFEMFDETDTTYSTNLLSSSSYTFSSTNLNVNLVFNITPAYEITFVIGTTDSEGYNFIGSAPTFASGSSEKQSYTFLTEFGTLPNVNSITGYDFVGWFTNNSYTNKVESTTMFDSDNIELADLKLYAKFDIKKYTLNFAVNDNSLAYFGTNSLSDIPYGATISRSDKTLTIKDVRTRTGVPTREETTILVLKESENFGYNISVNSWIWNAGGTFGTSNSVPDVGVTGSIITITANLSKTAIEITVTLNVNNQDIDGNPLIGTPTISLTSFTVKYGNTYNQLVNPTLTGYTFKEWQTADGAVITSTTTVNFNEDVALYAQWEINKWKITINVNSSSLESVGGTDSVVYENMPYGTSISTNGNEISIGGNFPVVASAKTIRGYIIEFAEWREGSSTLSRTSLGNANLTITAVFSQEARVAKFTFNVNDKDSENEALINTPTAIADKNITYGTSFSLPSPTLTGYTFQGWHLDDGSKVEQSGISDFVFDGDEITVYAKWNIKKFKIVISSSDSTKAIPSVTEIANVKYNTAVSISASDEKNITIGTQNVSLTPQGIYALHDGKTLDVVWKIADTSFTNTANVPDSTGDTIQILATLTGKNVNVELSCKDKDNYNEDLILNGITLPTHDIQLVYGGKYSISSYNPSLTGYNFTGWHNLSGDKVETTDVVTVNPAEKLSLIAYFDIKEYDITISVTGTDVTDGVVTKKAGKLEYVYNGSTTEDTSAQLVIKNVKHFTRISLTDNVLTFSNSAVLTAKERSEEFKGYTITFGGWQNVSDGKVIDSNLNISANFTATGKTFTITFSANGGKVQGSLKDSYTTSVTYGQTFATMSQTTFVKEGFVLDGWSTSQTISDGDWKEFDKQYKYYVADDSTIYAYWISILLNIDIVVSDDSLGTVNSVTLIQIEDVPYGTQLSASGMSLTINTDVPTEIFAESNKDYNRTGYSIVFNGYSADGEIFETHILRKNLIVRAVFVEQANSYTLRYVYDEKDSNGKYLIGIPKDNNGNDAGNSKTIVFDEIYGAVPTLKLAGYDFKGWFLNQSYTQAFNTSATHTQPNDVTIYAKWEIHVYEVTFELDANLAVYANGTGKLQKEYEYGTTIEQNGEKLTVTKREVSGSSTEEIVFSRKVWTGYDIVFVDFVLNGSTTISTSGLTFDDEKVKNDGISIKTNLNKVAKKFNVSFVGGSVDNDGETLIGTPTIIGSTKITVTYDSTYNDGGKMPTPELAGYNFVGWKLSSGEVITSSDVVKITRNENLIATWDIKYYQVNVRVNNDNYGQVDNSISQSYKYNTQIVIDGTQISVSGQTSNATATFLAGYNTQFTHFERKGKELSTFNIIDDGDVEIIAIFDRTPNKYRIVYNLNDIDSEGNALLETPFFTSASQAQFVEGTKFEYTYNENYSKLAEARVVGYEFAGWYFDRALTQRLRQDSKVDILEETNVYAKWIINKLVINASVVDSELGVIQNATIVARYKSSVNVLDNQIIAGNLTMTAQVVAKKGYTTQFVKWTNYSDQEIPNSFVITQNMEIKAVFSRSVNTYKVSYYADGIDVSFTDKNIQFDTKYGELPSVADREGYDKGEWYLDANYRTKVTDQTKMQTDCNHTLYFKWIIQKYDINFVIANEELGSLDYFELEEVEYNTLISANGNTLTIGQKQIKGLPTLVAGYDVSVEYWSIDGERITETTLKRQSTIEVKFIKNPMSFVVTYETKTKDINGNKISGTPELNGEETRVITYDSSYGELPTPTLEGYVFAGWYSDENFTKKVDESTIVKTAKDHKLYAKWIKTMTSSSIGTIVAIAVGVVMLIAVIGIVVGVRIKKDKEKDYFDMGV